MVSGRLLAEQSPIVSSRGWGLNICSRVSWLEVSSSGSANGLSDPTYPAKRLSRAVSSSCIVLCRYGQHNCI